MNQTTRQLLRALDRLNEISKERERKEKRLKDYLLERHIKYEAYKASQTEEVPWCPSR